MNIVQSKQKSLGIICYQTIIIETLKKKMERKKHCDVVANVLDRDIIVREFELQFLN